LAANIVGVFFSKFFLALKSNSSWIFLIVFIREAALIEGAYLFDKHWLEWDNTNVSLSSFGKIPTGSNRIKRGPEVRTFSIAESIRVGLYI
jgi:hypothetical protein